MSLTRRDAALLAAAAMAAPGVARAEAPPPPIVFVAPGPKAPSRAAYEDAIAQGADFLTAPVAVSSDGELVVAPNNELSLFTDVASRPDFAARRKDKTIDGMLVSGWFSDDFTLHELTSLLTGPAKAGGRALAAPPTLLSLQEVIDLARAGSVGAARVVGVSPRLVHPGYFAVQDVSLERALARIVRLNGYDSPAAAMIVQSNEPAALRAFGALSQARRLQLIDTEGGPSDPSALRYQAMANADGLTAVRAWAGAIGPPESLVIQPGPKGSIMSTGFVQAAHAAALLVYAHATPPAPHEPFGAARTRLMALFLAGADGVVCADVATAARARGDAMDRLRQRRD
jgi:glycerophosphoryl diester phosphodiesterase